jgi:hypothetical protein
VSSRRREYPARTSTRTGRFESTHALQGAPSAYRPACPPGGPPCRGAFRVHPKSWYRKPHTARRVWCARRQGVRRTRKDYQPSIRHRSFAQGRRARMRSRCGVGNRSSGMRRWSPALRSRGSARHRKGNHRILKPTCCGILQATRVPGKDVCFWPRAAVFGHLPPRMRQSFRNTVSSAGCGGSLIAIALIGPLVTIVPACAVPLGMMISVPALNSLRSPPSHIDPLPSTMY